MTVIRIDPVELEEVASLLDTTAREYESLSAVFSSPDLGSMPANIAGIVGQAYAEARSTVTALASELVSEARVLRFRGATAAEEGGLGCHLGSLGGLGYADTSSSFLSPFDTALVGSLATAWSGLLVGAQAVASGTGIAFGGTAFASGSTTASGGQLNFSSSSVMLGGGRSAGTTIVTLGGYQPSAVEVTLGPATTQSASTSLVTLGGSQPFATNLMHRAAPSASASTMTLTLGGNISDEASLSRFSPAEREWLQDVRADDPAFREWFGRLVATDSITANILHQAGVNSVHHAREIDAALGGERYDRDPFGSGGSYYDPRTGERWNV